MVTDRREKFVYRGDKWIREPVFGTTKVKEKEKEGVE